MIGSGRGPFRMSGRILWISRSGRLALPDVRELSGDPLSCPGGVGGYSRCLVVVRRTSLMSRSGQKSLPYVCEWSDGPPGCPGVVGRPY